MQITDILYESAHRRTKFKASAQQDSFFLLAIWSLHTGHLVIKKKFRDQIRLEDESRGSNQQGYLGA